MATALQQPFSRPVPPPPTSRKTCLVVGWPDALIDIQQAIPLGSGVRAVLDPTFDAQQQHPHPVWGRDWRVVLPSGKHLVPYPLWQEKDQDKSLTPEQRQARHDAQVLFEDAFKAVLPQTSAHFLERRQLGYGAGCASSSVQKAHEVAKRLGIVSVQGATAIEGGNYFSTPTGGIVGIHSVLLSLLSLEDQHFFDDEVVKRDAAAHKPSDFFIRMARNRKWEEEKKQCRKENAGRLPFGKWNEQMYQRRLQQPVHEIERQKYSHEAQILQEKWRLTTQQMEKELEIEAGRLVIIDQREFHIDLEMTVRPDGTAVIRDPEKEAELIQDCCEPEELIPPSDNDKQVWKCNAQKLREADVPVRQVPGFYLEGSGYKFSFFNGLFIGNIFLTGGWQRHPLFVKQFADGLEMEVVGSAECAWLLRKLDGGFRCITWEALSEAFSQVEKVKCHYDDQRADNS